MELDVLEVYTPTEKDREEVERYRKKARQKTFSNKEKKYYLVRKTKKEGDYLNDKEKTLEQEKIE